MRNTALRKRKKLIRAVVLLSAAGGVALAADRIQPLMLRGAAKMPIVEMGMPGAQIKVAGSLSALGAEPLNITVNTGSPAASSSPAQDPARTIIAIAPTAPHRGWPVALTKSAEADTPPAYGTAQSVEAGPAMAQSVPAPIAPHAGWPVAIKVADSVAAPMTGHVPSAAKYKADPSQPIVAIAPKADDTFGADFERTHKGAAQIVLTRYNRKTVRQVGDVPLPIVKAALPAARDPGFNLVECIAGCGSANNAAVYYAPRVATQTGLPIIAAGVSHVSAPAPTGSEASIITCVAGCYSTPKVYVAKRAPSAVQHAALEALPSVTPTFASVVPTSATYEAPKPMVMKAKLRKPRVRNVAHKSKKPLVWRTVTHAGAAQLPPRAWRTVVRY